MKWTLPQVLEATGGHVIRAGEGATEQVPSFSGVSTDTRTLQPGEIFVALEGERFDGHRFVSQAVERGAACVLVHRRDAASDLPATATVVAVADTLKALGDLSAYVRSRHRLPVVGITGSNGKTSTKEMVASILAVRLSVLKNPGNFNNLIGVPLTLLGLSDRHEAAVVEMGINVPGEMERLAAAVRPTVGLITNVHPAHLEGLGSVDRVLEEKARLWDVLGPEGIAVVNLDDPRLEARSERLSCRKVTFSIRRRDADVHLASEPCMDRSGTRFTLVAQGRSLPVRLPVLGHHQVQNAVAAAAAALAVGVSTEDIPTGLASHRPVPQRMETLEFSDGSVLINDCYNANPRSMEAALETLERVAPDARRVIVLGEMRELGPRSAELHRSVGKRVAAVAPAFLITMGEHGKEIRWGALEAGLPEACTRHAADHREAARAVLDRWEPGQWILVKGSRGMTMERVTEALVAQKKVRAS
ncbi:UDP-N-acetylmuramoyl-tripeptide--D-alanyl-D-alanine ligase [Desulfacinum hydrothermale DSM 13146]|uniref:UDP-N-acetylmuramoyl-tripeptide--D-alanyl-D-alanine ligase n=1 Tax=Desulfacinum hydrothermale DSM 13146 TaxID=1121390 RepID=A0A1W1XBR5_9BACT|nr:UDP-N-acetylmuramoyl-tripeptide--D-alanyl-D-alanine ligase [Desulfacinum hydrothermale]SMC20951.1 UDP-N-acetylmuramoyl-tripeptide--D-alanyl-D-alanine ligase [Desulfacinum hydrothermale DSM 13146]